ncbi:MAG: hypothetical protein AAB592_01330 [Patescibacteria group bacterium]
MELREYSQKVAPVYAMVERMEERSAVLRNEQTGEFHWPVSLLPNEVKVGDTVTISLSFENPRAQTQQTNVDYLNQRTLLEELIN